MTASEPPSTQLGPRVVLDESVLHDLLLHLASLVVSTVQALGCADMKNGALLKAARDAGYDVLVTVDRRVEYQQNIAASGIAVVVLTRALDTNGRPASARAEFTRKHRCREARGSHSRCRITIVAADGRARS